LQEQINYERAAIYMNDSDLLPLSTACSF